MIRPVNWRPMLQPGEALLWQGRPYPALGLIAPRRGLVLAGLAGLAAVAVIVALRLAVPGAPGAGQVLALLAALLVTGLPLREMRARRAALLRRAYALTDRRVLRLEDLRDPASLAAAPLPKGAAPQLTPEAHGLSTLHFGPGTPRFEHLKDAAAVARLSEVTR